MVPVEPEQPRATPVFDFANTGFDATIYQQQQIIDMTKARIHSLRHAHRQDQSPKLSPLASKLDLTSTPLNRYAGQLAQLKGSEVLDQQAPLSIRVQNRAKQYYKEKNLINQSFKYNHKHPEQRR